MYKSSVRVAECGIVGKKFIFLVSLTKENDEISEGLKTTLYPNLVVCTEWVNKRIQLGNLLPEFVESF